MSYFSELDIEIQESKRNNPHQGYANHHGYTDIDPYEIVEIISDKTIVVREMDAKPNDDFVMDFTPGGFCGHVSNQPDWVITSNENNDTFRIRLHKSGVWKSKSGRKFYLSDKPRKYYDYNF